MNIVEAFANYLVEEHELGEIGETLFISRAPSGVDTDNAIWWLVLQNSGISVKNPTGEWSQTSEVFVYYRSMDASEVYNSLEELNRELLAAGCFELVGYTIREVQTTGPFADLDLDNEERTVGVLQVSLTVYN